MILGIVLALFYEPELFAWDSFLLCFWLLQLPV